MMLIFIIYLQKPFVFSLTISYVNFLLSTFHLFWYIEILGFCCIISDAQSLEPTEVYTRALYFVHGLFCVLLDKILENICCEKIFSEVFFFFCPKIHLFNLFLRDKFLPGLKWKTIGVTNISIKRDMVSLKATLWSFFKDGASYLVLFSTSRYPQWSCKNRVIWGRGKELVVKSKTGGSWVVRITRFGVGCRLGHQSSYLSLIWICLYVLQDWRDCVLKEDFQYLGSEEACIPWEQGLGLLHLWFPRCVIPKVPCP